MRISAFRHLYKQMDNLIKDLENLNITRERKTGLVYHPDTLLHTYDEDELRCQIHVENPLRVKNIFNHLSNEGLVERCDYISDFKEIDSEKIIRAHGENYTEYLISIWPENSKKKKMTYTDTYYNEHSVKAARLAAEGTCIGAEKVFTGQWENGFCLVRPPGHHAAAKNNRIGGFCFINNVAVAIKDLQAKYGNKKIAVLDWDIHHGDSTQMLTYDDPNVLYISIHKYCNGEFYPGPSGSVHNTGEGDGVGFNLNFPINPKPGQFVGDCEYIYIFERMIYPVLKEFGPEMIMVSCGFDCLLYDQVGQFHVTQNALSMMLFQIRNKITSKILVVLEGGYNLKTIPIAAECLLRVLLGDFYPNKANKYLIAFDIMKKHLNLSELFLKNLDENLEIWSKFWPCLMTEDLIQLQESVHRMKHIKGAINSAPNRFHYEKENVIKRIVAQQEILNYEMLWAKHPTDMKGLIPGYMGTEIHGDKKLLKLENLSADEHYSSMNIVISDFLLNSHFLSEVFKQYKFYIKGYQIVDEEGDVIESRKGVLTHLNIEDTLDYCKRFFKLKTMKKTIEAVDKVLEFLDKVIVTSKKLNIAFSQSSIYVLVNRSNGDVKVRLLNLEYLQPYTHQNFFISMIGIHDFLLRLKTELDPKGSSVNK